MSYLKTKNESILARMIKTYLRRWWILNRLFHMSKHHFGMVVPLDYFLDWMVGLDVHQKVPAWYTGKTKRGKFHGWVTWKLYNSESARKHRLLPDTQIRELRKLIEECADKKLINVISGNSIELASVGSEQYSVSYLIFGHEYARKIWTGLFVGFLILLAGWRLDKAFPKEPLQFEPIKVQLEYAPKAN